jgi:hypothetical protein
MVFRVTVRTPTAMDDKATAFVNRIDIGDFRTILKD